ncbi:MAG: DUF4249 family protein [Bacteroidetes bacterium]|nr:DUF4249 family protein [Bacteroidota bacterium]
MNNSALFGKSSKSVFNKIWQRLFVIIPAALLLVNGCEQTVSNPELPYEEKLVINASLGDSSASAYISRTLPLTQKYTAAAALVKDARVTLTSSDGSQVIMTFDSLSKYYTIQNTNFPAGKSYSLRVEWKGLVAIATAIIPPDPEWGIDTVIIADTTGIEYDPNNPPTDKYRATIKLKINALEDISYRTDFLCYTSSDTSDVFSFRFMQRQFIGRYKAASDDFFPWVSIFSEEPVKAVLIKVYSSTSAFDDFYKSQRYGDHDGGNIFGSFGTNPKFNVYGDGIGVFDSHITGTKKVLVRLE